MPTLGYADLPVPAGGDGPTVPAHLAALAEAIDPHLRHDVADQAERDADFAGAPVHTLVTAANGTMWVKVDTDNTWVTIWEPLPAWRPITLAAGLEEGDVQLGIRRTWDKRVSLKGRIRRTDATLITDPNAVNLGAVPSDCIPAGLRTWAGTCSAAGTTTDATGRMEILGASTSSSYGESGDLLWWYQGTDGTGWVDISGDYWMD